MKQYFIALLLLGFVRPSEAYVETISIASEQNGCQFKVDTDKTKFPFSNSRTYGGELRYWYTDNAKCNTIPNGLKCDGGYVYVCRFKGSNWKLEGSSNFQTVQHKHR